MLSSSSIYLNSIEDGDLCLILDWRNNPKFRINFREHREIGKTQQKKWLKLIRKSKEEYYWMINESKSGEKIGVCGLNFINWINRNCQLSIYIGKDDLYIDDFGYAKESTELMIKYAFDVLNLKKIYSEVYEFDSKKLNLLKNSGFLQEGELKKHIFKEGKYYTSYIYSIIKG